MTQTAYKREYSASPAQTTFIANLMNKREVPADVLAAIRGTEGMTSRQASGFIDILKGFPYKPAVGADETPWQKFLAAFEGVEDSKYAIPGQYLAGVQGIETIGDDDMLFLEVKTYKGKRYLNRLHGAPGDFTRSRLDLNVGRMLLLLIKGHHVEYAQNFGKHFTVCGRCAAPLTDTRSRELHLGPECRKVWGL